MIRRPPRSTLFPTRRSSDLTPIQSIRLDERVVVTVPIATNRVTRSEEHTSELQSHSDLVCRLLLEKKKKIKHNQKAHYKHKERLYMYEPSTHRDECNTTRGI